MRPVVVVIGAGFGGLQVVKGLRRCDCDIQLIDRRNHHLFQPLLYQVAAAALSPGDIAYPIRRIFRNQNNVVVSLASVSGIDLSSQEVLVGERRIRYDYLVVAAGATHSYLGHDEWNFNAPGLKTIEDALSIRRRILLAFEEAEHETDERARRAKLTFVVVGGGPTGVELAGALREIAANAIPCDFRSIDTTTSRIILLQGGDRLLPGMHPDLSARALRDLQSMGVEVRLNARVTHIDEKGLSIGTERLDCQNVIWAAGVQATPLNRTLGAELDKSGRVMVMPDLSVPGHPNVFVIGDAASVKKPDGSTVPGLAPAAIQMGKFVAQLIRSELRGHNTRGRSSNPEASRPAFAYNDKGSIATIGKAKAVADIKGFRFGGFVAWLMWGLIHVAFLISFRSRFFVLTGWVVDFILNSRDVRLITGDVTPRTPSKSHSPQAVLSPALSPQSPR